MRRTGWLSFRGVDGLGLPLGGYLGLVAFLFAYAWLAAASAPLLGILACSLAGAVLWPLLQLPFVAGHARVTSKYFEPLLVCASLAMVTWAVWAPVYGGSHFADTKDHHIMLERTRELAQALGRGHLQYYTHYLQGGDALWDLYPIVPGLVVALLDTLLPDSVPFERCYTLMVVGTYWLRGVSVYALGRSVARPLPAALVTAASLLDVGVGVWDGTWSATIHWGLVHSNVGISFAALGLAAAAALMRRPTVGRLWRAALAVSAALLSHPLALLYIAASVGMSAVSGLSRGMRLRRLLWLASACALGGLLSAWYFLPYSAGLRALGVRFPWPGETFGALGLGLLTGQRPFGDLGGFYGFALLACLAALATNAARGPSTQTLVRGYALGSLLLFCLILTPFAIETQAFELLPNLLSIQPPRLFMVLKVSLLPVAAWALERLFCHLRLASSLRLLPTLLRGGVVLLLLFGLAPSLAAGSGSIVHKLRKQGVEGELNATPAPHGSEVEDDLARVMSYIGERRRADPTPVPFRMLARWASWEQWGLWWFPWRVGVPLVLQDPLPGNFLAIRPQHANADCLREWNVRFVIVQTSAATSPPPGPPTAGALPVFAAGRYFVYELAGYEDRFVVAEPGVQISELQVQGDAIRFRVSGASRETRVRVRAAWFPRWRATQNGNAIPVQQVPAHAGAEREEQLGLEVQDGVVELRCDGWMPAGKTGVALSGLGLLLGLGLGRPTVRLRIAGALANRARALSGFAALRKMPPWALVLLALGALTAAALARQSGADRARLPGPVGDHARLSAFGTNGQRRPCTSELLGSSSLCAFEGTTTAVAPGMGRTRGYKGEFAQLWPGVAFSLPAAHIGLVAEFDRLRGGRSLLVKYNTSRRVNLEVRVGAQVLHRGDLAADWAELRLPWLPAGPQAPLSITVYALEAGGTDVVFSATVLD